MYKRILIISPLGLGNCLSAVPIIMKLKKTYSSTKIDILLGNKNWVDLFNESPCINRVYLIQRERYFDIFNALKILFPLRRQKYDLSICTFPSNNILFNIVAFIVNAKIRIVHKYYEYKFFKLPFLQNIKVPVLLDAHDNIQNLNLLCSLGIHYTPDDMNVKEFFTLKYSKFMKKYLKKNNIKKSDVLIGVHPGSSIERGMISKRWGLNNFILLSKKLLRNPKIKLIFFGSKDEKTLLRKIQSGLDNSKKVLFPEFTLVEIISFIDSCHIFIGNDSGLVKLSESLNVNTITLLMGYTDPDRAMERSKNKFKYVLANSDCYPCMSIRKIGRKFKCKHGEYICGKTISVEHVYNLVEKALV